MGMNMAKRTKSMSKKDILAIDSACRERFFPIEIPALNGLRKEPEPNSSATSAETTADGTDGYELNKLTRAHLRSNSRRRATRPSSFHKYRTPHGTEATKNKKLLSTPIDCFLTNGLM